MYYILKNKLDDSRIDRIQSSSLKKAKEFFRLRKQMDEDTFNKLFYVSIDK